MTFCRPNVGRSRGFTFVNSIATFGIAALVALGISLPGIAYGKPKQEKAKQQASALPLTQQIEGEERLLQIYTLMARGQSRDALRQATQLTNDLPHFQLAQLVYGDLLAARTRPVKAIGDVPDNIAQQATAPLKDLREESQRRIKALKERPTAGSIPSQFLALSTKSRHAIAVDASRSRLYLLENTPAGLTLVDDYYISVGKAGTAKLTEGDQRTPLGVYYITSRLDPATLKEFYGSGALPINYPNILDAKLGKTGSGIWLHGTPPNQYVRAPQASDGCVVLANPDLERIARTIEPRTTPVVIANQLQWVKPAELRNQSKAFENALFAWRNAKTSGNLPQILSFYTTDFSNNGKNLNQWTPTLKAELEKLQGRTVQLKDISYLYWNDSNSETMVVTFGEVAEGIRAGWTKRQYWIKQGAQWKIFYEGVL